MKHLVKYINFINEFNNPPGPSFDEKSKKLQNTLKDVRNRFGDLVANKIERLANKLISYFGNIDESRYSTWDRPIFSLNKGKIILSFNFSIEVDTTFPDLEFTKEEKNFLKQIEKEFDLKEKNYHISSSHDFKTGIKQKHYKLDFLVIIPREDKN